MCMPVYYSWPIPKQWSSLMLALWLNKATIGWKYQRTKSISHSQWTVVLIFTVDLTGFRITISGCVCDAIPRKVWLRREDSGHGQHYLNDWGPGLNPKERSSVPAFMPASWLQIQSDHRLPCFYHDVLLLLKLSINPSAFKLLSVRFESQQWKKSPMQTKLHC